MNTPIPRRSGREHGFTLLELLLSLSLTAMLLGLLSAGTYTVISDWQRDTSSLDGKLDQALILLQLERALLAAFPHSYIHPERLSRTVYFEGDENELRFVSAASPQRQGDLTAWRIVSTPDDGVRLALTPAFGDNPSTRFDTMDTQSLLPGYEATFRYLLQRNQEEKDWLPDWPGEEHQSLPIAVEMILTPIDDPDGQPLEIVAPIKAYRHEEIEPVIPVF